MFFNPSLSKFVIKVVTSSFNRRRFERYTLYRELLTEWPTLLVLVLCYAFWLSSLFWSAKLGWFCLLGAALTVTLHSSLQHEVLHGHPTRNTLFNELLVFPALGLFVPYRRFRYLHMRHHRDTYLTDPFEDPESWYLSTRQWNHLGLPARLLLTINASLLGRMLIGPALSVFGLCRSDLKLIRQGRRQVTLAWIYHFLGVIPVLFIVSQLGVSIWLYILLVAYPAMSLLMIRTFAEHRAAEKVGHRTAVVEAGRLLGLLFLNNNLHAVHHRHPRLAWYMLPDSWRRERNSILTENNHYYFKFGYLSIARRWLLAQREPVKHPIE